MKNTKYKVHKKAIDHRT